MSVSSPFRVLAFSRGPVDSRVRAWRLCGSQSPELAWSLGSCRDAGRIPVGLWIPALHFGDLPDKAPTTSSPQGLHDRANQISESTCSTRTDHSVVYMETLQ
jgi:hypothetical protein